MRSQGAVRLPDVAPRSTRGGLGTLATLLFTSAALIAVLILRGPITGMTLRDISLLASAISFGCLVVVALRARTRIYSAGFLYLLVLALFHLGLALLFGLDLPFGRRFTAYLATWFADVPTVRAAIYLSVLAVVAFTAAYAWVGVSKGNRRRTGPELDARPLIKIGAVLSIGGAMLFVGDVLVTDPAILSGGHYDQFNALVGGTGVAAAGMIMVALGGPMVAAGPPSTLRRGTLWILVVFGAMTLMVGSRTAFMYAAVGIVVAVARVQQMPRIRTALIGIVIAVCAMGVVAQLRGGRTADSSAVSLSPIPAITEMGASLRPVAETVLWQDVYHEHEYHGVTYIAGVLRIYERFAGLPRPRIDQRFAQTLMNERVAGLNLGYSSVAEAYLNFGTPGVVVIFLLTGGLLGVLDRYQFGNRYGAAMLGMVTFVLAYEVRQSANIMLTLLTAIVVLMLIARFLGRDKTDKTRSKRPLGHSEAGYLRDTEMFEC